jgi:hypothetical protein
MSAPVEKGTRVEACNVFLEIMELEPKIHTLEMFSDKAIFRTSSHVNKHKCIFWGTQKIHIGLSLGNTKGRVPKLACGVL